MLRPSVCSCTLLASRHFVPARQLYAPSSSALTSASVFVFSSSAAASCSCAGTATSAATSATTSAPPSGTFAPGSSNAKSVLNSGKKRSIRFHVSVQNSFLLGSCSGGTRYPVLAMNKSTFFKFSRTASSCKVSVADRCLEPSRGILTRLSPCPLFMRRSMISMIFIQRSSMPSHSERSTRYFRKTLQSSDEDCTRISLIPSRSDENTSGFRSRRTNGNRTLPKIAVHSSGSVAVNSADRRVLCREEKASWRTSRHGFVHCLVSAWKIGSQYADQAGASMSVVASLKLLSSGAHLRCSPAATVS